MPRLNFTAVARLPSLRLGMRSRLATSWEGSSVLADIAARLIGRSEGLEGRDSYGAVRTVPPRGWAELLTPTHEFLAANNSLHFLGSELGKDRY